MPVFLAVTSLRHEGCFFSTAGLPKLASEQAGGGEETMGEALASASGFICFFQKRVGVAGLLLMNINRISLALYNFV